jgi:hypothetical protein
MVSNRRDTTAAATPSSRPDASSLEFITTQPSPTTRNAAGGNAAPTAVDDTPSAGPPPQPRVPQQRAQRGPDVAPNNLRAAMNQMLDIVFDLKNEATDPIKVDQTLKDLAAFERDVAVCKMHMPPSISGLPDQDKAGEIESYRLMMSDLTRTSLDLEDAVHDRKPDEVKKLLKQIDEIELNGHQEFVPP